MKILKNFLSIKKNQNDSSSPSNNNNKNKPKSVAPNKPLPKPKKLSHQKPKIISQQEKIEIIKKEVPKKVLSNHLNVNNNNNNSNKIQSSQSNNSLSVKERKAMLNKNKKNKFDNKGPAKMVETGRAKVIAPIDDLLVVYRGEKSERNTLQNRVKSGGLTIYQPSSKGTPEDAFQVMINAIEKYSIEIDKKFKPWNEKVMAYTAMLRDHGQPDALATARSSVGAYSDNFNYTIKIPGIQLFEWGNKALGPRIQPGSTIKKDYIVLNGPSLQQSTIFGIGHITGTQEVTFYTKIPSQYIDSVQEKTYSSRKMHFKYPKEYKQHN